MKPQHTILTLATITLLLTNPAATQQGPTVQLEATTLNWDPAPLQSGEDGRITFKITNTGNTQAENVQVNIPQEQFPFTPKPGEKTNYTLGTITPGQEYYITVEVLIDEEARDGENQLKATTQTKKLQITHEIPTTVQSNDIEINLANLQTTPSTLQPDTDNNQLTLDIVNNGEKPAENVQIQLDLPETFKERSSFSTRQSLGTIQDGETKKAQFNFDIEEQANEGNQEIQSTITYSASDDTTEVEQKETFQTYISGKPQYETTIENSELIQGQKGTITLNVTNVGSEDSESTRVRVLDNSDLPFDFTSSNKYLGTLNQGQTGQVQFTPDIEADAPIKKYMLDFEIRGVQKPETFLDQQVQQLQVNQNSSQETSNLYLPLGVGALLIAVIAALVIYKGKDESEEE